MRKSEIEKARRTFMDAGTSTATLRAKIARDLEPIRNAYEIAAGAWDQVELALQNVKFDERPTRELRQLAATMKDLAATLVSLRDEARTTTAYHAGERQAAIETLTKVPNQSLEDSGAVHEFTTW
jgi:HD superfamily phosphodiesterase